MLSYNSESISSVLDKPQSDFVHYFSMLTNFLNTLTLTLKSFFFLWLLIKHF